MLIDVPWLGGHAKDIAGGGTANVIVDIVTTGVCCIVAV